LNRDWPVPVTDSPREPLFNIPAVVTVLFGIMLAVQTYMWFASDAAFTQFLMAFAFIPARYEGSLVSSVVFPYGLAGQIWSFFTYAFVHGGWTHLIMNGGWLLVFGTPVARRFGAVRFTLFFLALAAGGAFVHLTLHKGDISPLVGASGAISGMTAAALRFFFVGGRGFALAHRGDDDAYMQPAAPLTRLLASRSFVSFVGLWVGLNLLFGFIAVPFGGGEEGQSIAWDVHLGGFLAGLLLFPLFDPVRRA
jgi:membrane associated rhomboid family serine protease